MHTAYPFITTELITVLRSFVTLKQQKSTYDNVFDCLAALNEEDDYYFCQYIGVISPNEYL